MVHHTMTNSNLQRIAGFLNQLQASTGTSVGDVVSLGNGSCYSQKNQSDLVDDLLNPGKYLCNYSLEINFKVAGKLVFVW